MANHKSAIKRIRQTAKRNIRNSFVRATMRTAIKKVRSAIEGKNIEEASKSFLNAQKLIAKTASKGVIKLSTSSRYISRLASSLNKLKEESTNTTTETK
jgi:small subunit ribosomal protein S20